MFLGRFLSGEHIRFLFFLCASFPPTNVFSKFSMFSCWTKELLNSSQHRISSWRMGDGVRAAIWTDGFYNILCRIMCCFARFAGKKSNKKSWNCEWGRESGHRHRHTRTHRVTNSENFCWMPNKFNYHFLVAVRWRDRKELIRQFGAATKILSHDSILWKLGCEHSVSPGKNENKRKKKNEKNIVFSKMRMLRVINFGVNKFSISMEFLAHIRCLWLASYREFSIKGFFCSFGVLRSMQQIRCTWKVLCLSRQVLSSAVENADSTWCFPKIVLMNLLIMEVTLARESNLSII